MSYYPPDHHETDMERSDREHDARLEREDRRAEKGPAPDLFAGPLDGLKRFISLPDIQPNGSGDAAEVLPRDIAEWPAAQARVEQLAEDYASVEVDRLPPMGAQHWLIRAYRANGDVDVFRVGSHGSLMPWGAR